MALPITPRRYVRYAKSNKVPAALLLFGLVIGLAAARRGAFPDKRQTAGLLIASLIVAMTASFAPDLVMYFLLALLFVVAIDEADVIQRLSAQLLGLINPPASAFDRGSVTP